MEVPAALFAIDGLSNEALVGITTLVAGAFSVMGTAIGFLWRENGKLRRDWKESEVRCQKRIGELEQQVLILQVTAEQSAKYTGQLPTQGQIVFNAKTGQIGQWNAGATGILHWTEREMIGRQLVTIIPPKYRTDHLTAVSRMVSTGAAPKYGPHKLYALRKDGSTVRITAHYSGYRDGEDYIVIAVFTERFPRPDSDSKKIEVDSDDPNTQSPQDPDS
jgi:PAS domain S-box-containing protein